MEEKLSYISLKLNKASQHFVLKKTSYTFGKLLFILPILSLLSFLSFYYTKINITLIYESMPLITLLIFCFSLDDVILSAIIFVTYVLTFGFLNEITFMPIALIFGIVSCYLFNFFSKNIQLKNIKSKIPSNVLSMIDKYLIYISLILSLLILMSFFGVSLKIVMVIDILLKFLLHPVIYLLLIILTMGFWSFGLHGDHILAPYIEPVLILTMYYNSVGMEEHIINASFHTVFFSGTGSGVTMGLILAVLLFSKSKSDKAHIKEHVVDGLFNINEGIIFGLPVLEDVFYMIPFLLVPIITVIYGYILTFIGFISPFKYATPWITPPLIKSFLASGGQWSAVLAELGVYLISFTIYSIFVLIRNREVKK